MRTAVVLSHTDIAHELGHLEPWLVRNDYRIERIYREHAPALPSADLLIVMGSPTSVASGHCAPAAKDEIDAVADWLRNGRPYLGLCFGAQVLARAGGGEVTRMPSTYRGFHDLALEGVQGPTLDGPWLVWHDDSITAPSDADVIARLPHADLAFRIGDAWGLQPHIEVSPESLQRMAVALGASADVYGPLVSSMTVSGASASGRVDQFLDAAFGARA